MTEIDKNIKCAIIGASGYAGAELLRLLASHPQADIVLATSNTYEGKSVAATVPHLYSVPASLTFAPHSEALSCGSADVYFLSLPHGKAHDYVTPLLAKARVIDLSADYRLTDAAAYEKWYGYTHPQPDTLGQAVFGLTEIYRDRIRHAALLANPGCYPTSVALAMHPLKKLAEYISGPIIIDSKSGYSGAGRSLKPHLLFAEGSDEFAAYAVTGHRHTSEMIQEITAALGRSIPVTFTPHLIPVSRGILSTIYVPVTSPVDVEQLRAIYHDYYAGERFVHIMQGNSIPSVKLVRGTNNCAINVFADSETGLIKIISVIDNLIKGAAGQAVQNMNLMFALPEHLGLEATPLMP